MTNEIDSYLQSTGMRKKTIGLHLTAMISSFAAHRKCISKWTGQMKEMR